MWRCIFDRETNVGVAFNREPGPGEYQRKIKPSLCGDFNNTPARYKYENNSLVEREGWQDELAKKELTTWREKISCGPLQFRRALRAAGLLDAVSGYIATADEETSEAWQYATRFYRNDPFIVAAQQLLGKTDEELDDIFRLALTFP